MTHLALIVTGSRTWEKPEMIRADLDARLENYDSITLLHGHNPNGADAIAHAWALEHPDKVVLLPFPADWKTHGPSAGPKRNQQMLEELLGMADIARIGVLAYPERSSRGTTDMMDRAAKAKVPVINRGFDPYAAARASRTPAESPAA